MKMNDFIAGIPIFCKHTTPLKETSTDTSKIPAGGKVEYMTDSEALVVNFDDVAADYVSTFAPGCKRPRSVDALALLDNRLAFIEFKNGDVDAKEIRQKVKFSLLMFCDLTNRQLKFTRDHMDFYLVAPPPVPKSDKERLAAQMEEKAGHIRHARMSVKKHFETLYFHNAHNYTKEEFAETAKRIQPVSLPAPENF